MQEMDYWFGELHTANVKTCIRVEQIGRASCRERV